MSNENTPDTLAEFAANLPDETPDNVVELKPAQSQTAEDYFAQLRPTIKTTTLRFYLGGKPEWAKVIGLGLTADQLAEINAPDRDDADAAEQLERGVRFLARVLSDTVVEWSMPPGCDYDSLCKAPQWFLEAVSEALNKADRRLPKDHQPKKAKGKKRTR